LSITLDFSSIPDLKSRLAKGGGGQGPVSGLSSGTDTNAERVSMLEKKLVSMLKNFFVFFTDGEVN
jgi:hypothetical protein